LRQMKPRTWKQTCETNSSSPQVLSDQTEALRQRSETFAMPINHAPASAFSCITLLTMLALSRGRCAQMESGELYPCSWPRLDLVARSSHCVMKYHVHSRTAGVCAWARPARWCNQVGTRNQPRGITQLSYRKKVTWVLELLYLAFPITFFSASRSWCCHAALHSAIPAPHSLWTVLLRETRQHKKQNGAVLLLCADAVAFVVGAVCKGERRRRQTMVQCEIRRSS
jgi:hypothetical protein